MFGNTAATYVPQGAATYNLTSAGSGGATASSTLATYSGGTLTYNPVIYFDIVGGLVVNVRVTFAGLYIGTGTPTMPTVSLPGSAGGAALTLTAGKLYASGAGYWVINAAGTKMDRYYNNAGTPAVDSSIGSVYLATYIDTALSGLLGGRENLFPDPFFTNYGRWEYLNPGDKGYALQTGWVVEAPRSTSPYPDGKQARTTGTAQLYQDIYLPNAGLANGDIFQIAWQAARASGSTANGTVFALYGFYRRDGTLIGSGGNLFTSVTGNLLDTTSRAFISSALTVPSTDAFIFRIAWANFAAVNVYVDACWLHKTSVPTQPSDNPAIPRGPERLTYLENTGAEFNNVRLKRVTYATRTVALAGASGTTTFSNNTGWAQSLLTSGAPAGGFNAVELPFAWTPATAPPTKLFAEIRTLNASAAKHPVNGRLVARGWIGLDPTTGGGDTYVILLHDPITGVVKTVLPADLDDRYTIAIFALQADGTNSASLYISLGTGSIPNLDSTYPNPYNALPYGGGSSTGSFTFGVTHLVLTSPVESYKTASAEFAASVAQAGEGTPLLIAAPVKFFGVVGREARIYTGQIQRRDPKDINFSAPTLPSGASVIEEGIKWTPTGVGTTAVTISSALGNNPSDSKTVSFIAVAASAASGNKACLFMGDSLIGNLAMLLALKAIEASQAVTTLTLLGTQGSSTTKNEGYSGTTLGSFFGATLAGAVTNPFWNGSTFSFSTWLANGTIAAQLSAVSKTEPEYVFIEAGKVDVGAATSDGAATALASAYASTLEAMITIIKAATTNTKVVVYTAEPGPSPTGEQISYGPLWRVRRNWMILAQTQITQFSGREAARIYVTATGCAVDPLTGWPRVFGPRSAALTRDQVTYATYATMNATLTQAAGIVAYATDVAAYFIKVGGSGVGYWRAAQEADGFAWRSTDSIHYANGAIQVAEANWALIKNVG